MKQLTKEEVYKRLKEKFPKEDFDLIQYTKQNEPSIIRCKKCGKEIYFKYGYNMFAKNKKRLCSACVPNKQEQINKKIEQFKNFISNSDDFTLLETDFSKVHADTLIACKCKKCGEISYKTMYDYLRGRGCLNCSGNKQKTSEDFQKQLSEDYKLLSPYKAANEKVKLQHSCGFVYEVTPHNYLTGKRCPKCSRVESKGESKIREFLEKNNIDFIKEYLVKINGHNLRFDYYLPELDLYIEYNGIQHYKAVKYFGGDEKLKLQKEYDLLKKDYAKEKLLIISYLEIDNINVILSNFIL